MTEGTIGVEHKNIFSSFYVKLVIVLIAAFLSFFVFINLTSAEGTINPFNITPGGEPRKSGEIHNYRLQFTCQDLGGIGCGTTSQIVIPLNNPGVTEPSMINDTGDTAKNWLYNAALTVNGTNAILSQGIVGNNYVIELNTAVIENGGAYGLLFDVTPPNWFTANNTTWNVEPSYYQTYDDDVTLTDQNCANIYSGTDPAYTNTCHVQGSSITSVATASLATQLSKRDATGCVDNCNTYPGATRQSIIRAQCTAADGGTFGRLLTSESTIVDYLPAGVEYISSSPAGGVYDIVTHTVTWEAPSASVYPAGCNNPQTSLDGHRVNFNIPEDAEPGDTFTNTATFDTPDTDELSAQSTYTVQPIQLFLNKVGPGLCTNDCVVVPDTDFTTNLNAACYVVHGRPQMSAGVIKDVLQPGTTYVSSTPAGGVYDPVEHSVTWNIPPVAFPDDCGTPDLARGAFTTTVHIPANAAPGTTYTNNASFNHPHSAEVRDSVTATVASAPPSGGGGFKNSTGFPGLPTSHTYPGDFNAGDWPTTSPEAYYNISTRYTTPDTFETEVFEPLICLNPTGTTLYNAAPSPADGTVPNCTAPAFHPTVLWFRNTAGFGNAFLAGWRPQVVLVDGTVIDLNIATTAITAGSTGATFNIKDQLPAFDYTQIAEIYLAPDSSILNGYDLFFFGHFSELVPGNTQTNNTVYNTPYYNGDPQANRNYNANLYVRGDERVIDVLKRSHITGASPLSGQVNLTAPTGEFSTWLRGYHRGNLPEPITVTDLLPIGEEIINNNDPKTVIVRFDYSGVIDSQDGTITVPYQIIENYGGTGRQAYQYTIPVDDPNTTAWDGVRTGGYYWDAYIAGVGHPAKYVDDPGTYVNEARVQVIGSTHPNQTCNIAAKYEVVPAGMPGAGEFSCAEENTVTRPEDRMIFETRKTNSPTSGSDGNFSTWIYNRVDTSRVPRSPVIVTDVLPVGQIWTNEPAGPNILVRFCTALCGSQTGFVSVPYTLINNYNGTGRQAIQYEVPPDDPNTTAHDGIRDGNQWFYAATDVAWQTWTFNVENRGEYTNNASIHTNDASANASCAVATAEGTVPIGEPGEGLLNCNSNAKYTKLDTGANFDIIKTGIGNLDTAEQPIGGTATGANPGNFEFGLRWLNSGSIQIKNVTLYDILPYVGDTGVGAALGGSARGSTWQPEFDGMVFPLPANTTVWYSLSTNPCRPEAFFPSIQPAGCVDDWSTTPPATLSDVRALKIFNSSTFNPLGGFEVRYKENAPVGTPPRTDAVNSVAGSGQDIGNNQIDASESVQFKLRVAGSPTMTTQAPPFVDPNTEVVDIVTLADTDGESGRLDWNLYGPMPPVNGSCENVDWSSAPLLDSGFRFVTGDGDFETPADAANFATPGCYTFDDLLTGQYWVNDIMLERGQPTEITTVRSTPSIETVINADGYSDDVTISDSAGYAGSLTWTLFGPVNAGPSGTCADSDWTGATVFASGTVGTTGDEVVTTTPPAAPTEGGCYSYQDELAGTPFTAPATSAVGQPAETFMIAPTPTMVTLINPDGYSDDVTITGTKDFPGTLTWTLYGPQAPGPDGTCATADWTTATILETNTVDITTDGTTTTTPAAQPTDVGCYSYADTLEGDDYAGPVESVVGQPEESFVVMATPQISTILNDDGYSDDVDIMGTNGFAGTLAWTLYGPVLPGPSDTCDDADWAGATVYSSGSVEITEDGVVTTTPLERPTEDGCYSYEDTLSGPNYTADAVSVVGQTLETFLISNPELVVTKVADKATANAGDTVNYTISINNPTTIIHLGATADDDLTDVIDDSAYNSDAVASSGTTSYSEPVLDWSGNVNPGETVTITYSVTIDNPITGDSTLGNIVIVPKSNCEATDNTPAATSSIFARLIDTITFNQTTSAAAEDDPDCQAEVIASGLSATGQSIYTMITALLLTSMIAAVGVTYGRRASFKG